MQEQRAGWACILLGKKRGHVPSREVSIEDLIAIPQQSLQHRLQAGLTTLRSVEQQAHDGCVCAVWEVHDFVEHCVNSRQNCCVLREIVLDRGDGCSAVC